MNTKNLLLPVFVLVALLQLSVPAKMIWDREDVLATGTEFKFKTAPIDPNDPFRGKYITLSYASNTIAVADEDAWSSGETIYVLFAPDADGFAIIESISREKPTETELYLKTTVDWVSGHGANELTVRYPFDRFYMEESKAQPAETRFRESQADTAKTTYAVVRIKAGDAVLEEVMVGGIPIGKLVDGE